MHLSRFNNDSANGIMKAVVDYFKEHYQNTRIDTYADNVVMQKQMMRNKFKKCGIIYVADGTPRIAYQWTKQKQEKESKKMERIKLAEFQILNKKEDITILDVREVDEFQAGHIEGALNAPLSSLDKGYEQLDASKRYYVICQGGMRSERACQFLETKGFDVVNVEGGMNQWKD